MNDIVKKVIVAYKVLSKMHDSFVIKHGFLFSLTRQSAGKQELFYLIQKIHYKEHIKGLQLDHIADFIVSENGKVIKSRLFSEQDIEKYQPTDLEMVLYG